MVNSASEVLTNAAKYIEKHGWCQGHYRNNNGTVCVMGAIDTVTRRRTNYMESYLDAGNLLLNYLNDGQRYQWKSLPQWNDSTYRTKEQVLQAMREAAKA